MPSGKFRSAWLHLWINMTKNVMVVTSAKNIYNIFLSKNNERMSSKALSQHKYLHEMFSSLQVNKLSNKSVHNFRSYPGSYKQCLHELHIMRVL